MQALITHEDVNAMLMSPEQHTAQTLGRDHPAERFA